MRGDSEDLLRDLKLMQQRMSSLLEERRSQLPVEHESLVDGVWQPMTDAFESDTDYQLVIDAAGVPRESINLSVDGSTLTVRGDRLAPDGSEAVRPLWVERSYGEFAREFDIPADVDEQRISASFKGGVLTVRMPKRVAERGGQFQISVE